MRTITALYVRQQHYKLKAKNFIERVIIENLSDYVNMFDLYFCETYTKKLDVDVQKYYFSIKVFDIGERYYIRRITGYLPGTHRYPDQWFEIPFVLFSLIFEA